MVETALTPLDVQDFQFKLQCKLRIFNEKFNVNSSNANLLAAASKFGLIFVACPDSTLQVIQLKSILSFTSKGEVQDYPRRTIPLPSNALYVAVNCDNTILAVIVIKDSCPVSFMYDIASFFTANIRILNEIRLSSTQLITVTDICWNPVLRCIFSVCLSDGCAHVFEIKSNGVEINSLEASSQSTCMCWSPKGKQIVIGSKNGIISQYKPDLKLVKTYPAPILGNVSVICIVWITNYQFAAVFHNNDDSTSRPSLCIVNVPKNEPVSFINFDDICYSSGDFRPHQFYLFHQPMWSIILAASANSMEVGVLGASQKEGIGMWQQWLQTDEARAELPLSSSKQETYPVGFSFDTASTHKLPWGENQTLPPMPLLYLLSHEGVLCVFNVINVRPEAASICSPPQEANEKDINIFCTPCAPKSLVENNIISQHNIQQSKGSMIQVSSNSIHTSNSNKFSPNILYTPEKNQIIAATEQEYKSEMTNTLVCNEGSAIPKQHVFNSIQSSQPRTVTLSSVNYAKDHVYSINPETSSNMIDLNLSDKQPHFDNSLVINLIKEVIIQFQVELTALQNRWCNLDVNVGSEEEKCELALQSDTLQSFFSELQDTTVTQRAEIYALKKMLIESFALQEEAVSRFRHVTNPYFAKVFPSQDLDPISSKQISDIKHFLYYIDSQLKQVNDYLDNEWSEFQDSCKKSVKEKLRIPTLEAVYQTMVRHYEILMRQNYIMKDIRTRIKACNRKKGHLPLLSNVSMENIKTNDLGLLECSMKKLHVTLQPEDILKKKFEFIEGNQKKFSFNKEKKFRTFLTTNSKLVRISPKKPSRNCLSNSVLLVTPAKLNKLPLAKPGGITSGTPIKISTNELIIKQQSLPLINSDNIHLVKSQISKKLSDYYEDITPPLTPNIMNLEPKNEFNHTQNHSVWNGKSCINDSIFKTNSLQNQKKNNEVNFGVTAHSNQLFNPTFTSASIFPKNVSVSVNNVPSTQVKSEVLKKNETLRTCAELSSLSFGTKNVACDTSSSDNTLRSQTQVNYSKIGDNSLIHMKSVTDTKIPSKSSITGFGMESKEVVSNSFSTSNTISSSFSKLSSITSKPPQIINTNVVNLDKSSVGSILECSQNPLVSTFAPKNLLSNSGNTTSPTGNQTKLTVTVDKSTDKDSNVLKVSNSQTSVTSTNYTPNLQVSHSVLSPGTLQSLHNELSTLHTNSNSVSISTAPTSKSSEVSALNSNVSIEPSLNINNLLASLQTTEIPVQVSPSGPFSFTLNSTTSSDTSSKLNLGQNLFGSKPSVTTSVSSFMGKPICSPNFDQNSPKIVNSIFGSITTTPVSTLFGQISTTNNTTITQHLLVDKTSSVPEKTTTATSVFKQTVTCANSSGSIFATSTVTSTGSIFDKTSKATDSSGTIFNQSTSVASGPVFEQIAANTTSGVAFGQSTTTTSITTEPIFKQTSGSIFGQTAISTATTGSIFGQPVSIPTTGSIFGQPIVSSSTAVGSIFSQTVTTSVTSGSIFGQSLGTPTTVTGSIFSQIPTTSTNLSGIFGQTPTKVTESIFGQSVSAGCPMTIFGQTSTNTNTSIFGQPVTTTTNTPTNIFGQTVTTSLVNSGTIFGQPTTSANVTENIFGQPSTSTSIFGSPTSSNSSPDAIFGKPTTTVSTFIQQSNENIFGSKAIFGQQPVFGQNNFGSNNTSGNMFGNTTAFGSNTSIFGSPGNSTFGSTSVQSPNTNTFTGSGQSVNQVGFGSPAVFQKSPSAFGAAPSFASTPSFGASPVFGGSPAFGSPQKVFGSPQANTFGTPTQQNSTFANIANQNTVGFGNLAQNQNVAQPPNSTQFSGGSFSNWR